MKKLTILLLVLLLVLGCFSGCGEVVGDIAGNVAQAAQKELEAQIKATFEKYKVEILDFKTAVGKLSGDSGDLQFFCAVLVQSDSDAIPQSIADSLSKLFHDAGIAVQTDSKIESEYLVHKELSFKDTAFGGTKTHYIVWFYTDKLPSLSDLESLAPTGGVG